MSDQSKKNHTRFTDANPAVRKMREAAYTWLNRPIAQPPFQGEPSGPVPAKQTVIQMLGLMLDRKKLENDPVTDFYAVPLELTEYAAAALHRNQDHVTTEEWSPEKELLEIQQLDKAELHRRMGGILKALVRLGNPKAHIDDEEMAQIREVLQDAPRILGSMIVYASKKEIETRDNLAPEYVSDLARKLKRAKHPKLELSDIEITDQNFHKARDVLQEVHGIQVGNVEALNYMQGTVLRINRLLNKGIDHGGDSMER